MPTPKRPQRVLAALALLVVLIGIVIAGTVRAGTGPAPTDVPGTQAPPTDPPPSDIPSTEPPPTSEPSAEPTGIPTSEPSVEPSVEPTDAPTVVPTAEPTSEPSVVPTEEPTAEPTATTVPTDVPGTPQVVPTDPPPPPPPAPPPPPPPPPAEREADVTCTAPGMDGATPGATPPSPESAPVPVDAGDWSLRLCTLRLDAILADQIQIRGVTGVPGWEVILVEVDAADTPGLLDASNNRVTLRPEEGEREVRFLLGIRRSCTAFPAARIEFEVVSVADGQTVGSAATALTLELSPPSPPAVALVSVQVDTEREPAPTTIWLSYQDAPPACGWQLLVTLEDPGDVAWELVAVNGPDGMTATISDGAVSLLLPPGVAADGEVAIMLVAPGTAEAATGPLRVEAFPWP